MRKLIIVLVIVFSYFLTSKAQHIDLNYNKVEENNKVSVGDSLTDIASMTKVSECSLPENSVPKPYSRRSYYGEPYSVADDSLHLPALTMRGQMPLMSCSYASLWGLDTWQLHKGLNMSLGASVFASFGKNAPHGAGFAQELSMMYAVPLSKNLSLALGGWISNAYWAHDRFTDAGVSAVLGYKFDNHWEAYVYGRKSLVNKPMPYHFNTMQELGDRIGAAVKYNFSPSFSVQVSVETGRAKLPDYNSRQSLFHGDGGMK